ncbi:hypothetical protein [Treponema sp.]|uniref:hypothetical protein n=1 Tax=Treponema sp. TaxID=166 RepID=UPI003FD8454C
MIQAGKKKIHEYKKEFNIAYSTVDRTGNLGLVELMNLNQFEENDCVYSQKIFASDTDFTNHTNNVRYVKSMGMWQEPIQQDQPADLCMSFFHIIVSYVELFLNEILPFFNNPWKGN